MEQVIKPKSLGAFVRAVSGLFITKNNPSGLTPKECTLIAVLIFILKQQGRTIVTKEIKEELANTTNHNFQVVTNYIAKLKSKGVINEDNKLHDVFFKTKIIIENGESNL